MFVIDKGKNRIKKISSKSFSDFGFKERENLQEWIANDPECLGENLLIIQKEFDGFNDTSERLDLLAIDKSGSLVIIENKLDDSGKDVNWQVLKYVSYCSTLTKQQIKDIYQQYLDKYFPGKNAEENIVEFYDGKQFSEITLNDDDQRMILVSGNFRKEVTSTVMWMLNHGLKIQCFKASLAEFEGRIFLDMEQIIPVKEAEEYIIKIADKNREDKVLKENSKGIEVLRRKFWGELLEEFNTKSNLYKNVNPTDDHWLSHGSGVGGIVYNFLITKSYVGVELIISKGSQDQNKKIFDGLYAEKSEIEAVYGSPLLWERLDDKKASRVIDRMFDVDISNEEDWDTIKEFLCTRMIKFEQSIKGPLSKVAKIK